MDTARSFSRDRVATASDDLRAEQVAALAQLFPEVMTEGKIDFEKLRVLLGKAADTRPERYSFTWSGKRDAIRLAQTPSTGTLVPEPGQSLNWDTTRNLFIEGDNLEVLKLLHRAYFGRVKMIYIDPPYNTGNDFVYPDDYSDPLSTYLEITGQRDASGNLLTTNADTSGRYHSRWLSMMYPRLVLARSFLRDDGVIFVSIDDNEVADLRLLMNEVFGEENFVAHIVWQKRYVSNVTAQFLSDMHDHILVFGKHREQVRINKLPRTEAQLEDYKNLDNDPRGPWRAQDLSASKPYQAGLFTIVTPAGIEVTPPPGRYWRCSREQYERWLADNRIWFGRSGNGRPMLKAFLSEVQEGLTPNTWWSYDFAGHNKEATLEIKALFDGASPFDTPKPVRLICRMLELCTDADALVLDFFSGAATTAQAALELNREDGGSRRFIMVQLPEPTDNPQYPTIADIAKERIRRVIAKLRQADEGTLGFTTRETPEDLGFRVFRLAPSHVAQWRPPAGADPEQYARQMRLMLDPIQAGAEHAALVWEAAIREGYGLASQITSVPLVTGNRVYQVADPDRDQRFYICLDDKIVLDGLRPLGLTRDDLFICRDVALDDSTGANLALQCRLKTI